MTRYHRMKVVPVQESKTLTLLRWSGFGFFPTLVEVAKGNARFKDIDELADRFLP